MLNRVLLAMILAFLLPSTVYGTQSGSYPSGPRGATGPVGPRGATGATGATGPTGPSGGGSSAMTALLASTDVLYTRWIPRYTPNDYSWNSVTYGNGLFVAVAYDGGVNGIMTSPDGVTWTTRVNPAPAALWWSVTYGGSLFVAVAVNNAYTAQTVMTSPDGILWTLRVGTAQQWGSVVYNGAYFCAVAMNGGISDGAMRSVNGITWNHYATPTPQGWTSVAYSSTTHLFASVSNTGFVNGIMTSSDCITWTPITNARTTI
jgi:hypothetical protein